MAAGGGRGGRDGRALALAAYFLVEGISRLVISIKMSPRPGWGWVLTSGIVTLLLAVLIWVQWPLSGVWAVGILVGIHILFAGCSRIALALASRSSG